MALPVALMAAGTFIQVAGRYQANLDQASAEAKNADFYANEAAYARESMIRESYIAQRNYAAQLSNQISRAAMGGADVGSGSVLSAFADTYASGISELAAIKRKGELQSKLAYLRSLNASSNSQMLSSIGYNALQAGTTVLTNTAAGQT